MFHTYLNLVGATITAVAKDTTLQQYLVVSRELQVRGERGQGKESESDNGQPPVAPPPTAISQRPCRCGLRPQELPDAAPHM
jgi:hypothetical protein